MAVMPVPKKVIGRIQSLISNFLWDNGKEARLYWISWNNICAPKSEGGLGIRSILMFKTALLGKLAWKFLENKSLWMKFIRSKKKRNGIDFNSFIWKAVKPLVQSLRQESCWCIGKGNTPLSLLVEWMDRPISKEFSQYSLKDAHANSSLWSRLIQCIPSSLQPFFLNLNFNNSEDRLIWKRNKTGIFNIKDYIHISRTSSPAQPKFSKIWQKWIPPKISIFVWRLMHSGIPTDDNIIGRGICIISKCFCCHQHQIENMEHLFFTGQKASETWTNISSILGKIPHSSLDMFIKEWILPFKKKAFLGSIALTAGMFCLWEIWIYRNKRKFEDIHRDCIFWIIGWLEKVVPLIPTSDAPTLKSMDICKRLRIQHPKYISCFNGWSPFSWGLTLSCNIISKHQKLRCGILIRNHLGLFIFGCCFNISTDQLLPSLQTAAYMCPHIFHKIVCIQTSHQDMELLSTGSVPWENLRLWRHFKEEYPKIKLTFLSSVDNNAATVLAYTGEEKSYFNPIYLPKPAELAITWEKKNFWQSRKGG